MNSSYTFRALILGATLFAAGSVQASTVTASAVVDWSQFSITGIDIGLGTPSIDWSFRDTTLSTQVFVQSGPDTGFLSQFGSISNWASPLDLASALLGSEARATGDAATLGVHASNGTGFGFTSASATRGGSYTVIGTGLVMFTVPYELTGLASISVDAGFGDFGSVSGQIWLNATSATSSQNSNAGETVFNSVFAGFPGDVQTFALSGVLTAVLSVNDGAFGNFSLSSSASSNAVLGGGGSPIPLPAAVWLLAGALLALLGFRPGRRDSSLRGAE